MSRIRQLSGIAVASLATLSGAYMMYDRQRAGVHASPRSPRIDYSNEDELYPLQNYLLFRPSGVQWINNWDLAEETKKQKNNSPDSKAIKPTGSRHLIFIRHGQYNEEGQGDENRSLTKLGRFVKLVYYLVHGFQILLLLFFEYMKKRFALVKKNIDGPPAKKSLI